MWDKITTVFASAAAMLSSDKAPPNTPLEDEEELTKINFLTSKKFFVLASSMVLLAVFYVGSVFILFLTAPVPSLTQPFVTIFIESIKIFAIIISVYLGLQATIDFKYGSQSNYQNNTETKTISEFSKHEKYLSGPKELDYSTD